MEIGIGISKKRDPALAAKEAFLQAKAEIGTDDIHLAMVFSSIELASPNLLQTLHGYLPKTKIVGCSSLAIISHASAFKHGLVLLLIHTQEERFTITCVRNIKSKTALHAGQELANELLGAFRGTHRSLAMIFCDGLIEEGSKLILGMQQSLGSSFPIAGGSASDNLRFQKTYLYYNQEILTDATVGILWGASLHFGLSLRHGWKPLGKPRTVTHSRGNVIKKIDGEPAVKLYQNYFAKELLDLRNELKYISTLYPIGLYLEGEEEYLLRNVIAIQLDGSLICQGDVPVDSKVRLMIGTKDSCLRATRQAIEEAKKNFEFMSPEFLKKKPQIKFVFVFDSVSRYILLRWRIKDELKIIQKAIGVNTPLIGLYTYGEQAPLKATAYQGKSHFHNQTIVTIAMGG